MDERALRLLQEPNYATVATLRRDGSVHAVMVWIDVEDGRVLLNSARGRDWVANVHRDSRVTVLVANRENPYEWVEVRGRFVEDGPDPDAHIDALALKYLGQETYPYRQADEERVKLVIEPEKVNYFTQG